jgi:hypothetical protein
VTDVSGLPVRPSSAVLGIGTATAVLLPKLPTSLVAATAYSTAQAVDGDVVELMSISGSGMGEDLDSAVRTATGTLSWIGAHALLVPVLRRLPLPRSVVALACGVAVAKLNDALLDKVRGARAAAAEMSRA